MSVPINDGGPAFPVESLAQYTAHGLSIRDYFAAKAMAVMPWLDKDDCFANHADRCYVIADAMLKARES